jgi:hypothetical protein
VAKTYTHGKNFEIGSNVLKKQRGGTKMAEDGTDWRPNPRQVKLAALLLDPEDQRNKKQKFASVKLPERTAYRWLKDPRFICYLNAQLDQYTDAEFAGIWRDVISASHRGNVQAMRLFFELKGKLGNINW